MSRRLPGGTENGSPEFKALPLEEQSSVRFSSRMPRSWSDPGGTLDTCHVASFGAGFSILLLDLLPRLNSYVAVSTFRRVRAALWPA